MVISALLPRPLLLVLCFLIPTAMLSAGGVGAEQADATGAVDLAAKILGAAGRLDVARLTVRNGNQGGAPEAAEFQRALEAELRRLGFGFGQAAATAATIEVTLSDSFQGRLAVAEIRSGDTKTVAMVLRPQGAPSSAAERATPVTLQLQPLLLREAPILDVLPLNESLLVLGTDDLVLQQAEGSDSPGQAARITHSRPWPRDPRGRVLSDGVSVRVYLPGIQCQGTLRPMALSCADSHEAWPLDGGNAMLVPDRNYFEAEGIRPFYSMVHLGPAENSGRLIAGIDGKTYLVSPSSGSETAVEGWGNDLAAVRSGCGSGRQILTALPGEEGQPDSLRAFEWIDLRVIPSGTPMRVPGLITALWPIAGGTSAVAVVHNTNAGRYEAYRISVACSR